MQSVLRFIAALMVLGALHVSGTLSAQAQAPVEPEAYLLPEWSLTGPVVLVWPEHLRAYRRMPDLYNELIASLPEDLDIALVATRPPSQRALGRIGRSVRYVPMPNVRTIRIRDWAGLPAVTHDGIAAMAKFTYDPTHLPDGDEEDARFDDHTGRLLPDVFSRKRVDIPLKMDGRSLTHNGRGVALVSNRIISDNETVSIPEIRDLFLHQLGVEHVIFLPAPPENPTGHITPYVRFVGENTILVAHDPDGAPKSKAYAERLGKLLRMELKNDVRILPYPRPYMDFFFTGTILWLAQTDAPHDAKFRHVLQNALPDTIIKGINLPAYEFIDQPATSLDALLMSL